MISSDFHKTAAFILLAQCVVLVCHADDKLPLPDDLDPESNRLRVSTPSLTIPFRATFAFDVTYHNTESRNWMIGEDPAQSGAVCYECFNVADPLRRIGERWGGPVFRRIINKLPDGTTTESIVQDPGWVTPRPINIMPQQRYVFAVAPKNWPLLVDVPGRWILVVEDRDLKIRSNAIELRLAYCNDSVSSLLEALRASRERSERSDLLELIERVGHKIAIEKLPSVRQHPEERAEREGALAKAIDEFEAWWKQNKETPAVQQSIDDINRKCGLDPAKVRKELAEYPKKPRKK